MMKTNLLIRLIGASALLSAKSLAENIPPINDHCVTAEGIALGETVTGDITYATSDDSYLSQDCMSKKAWKFDRGLWFRTIGNGGVYKATSCVDENQIQTIMGVFTGDECSSNLECVVYGTGWVKDEDGTDCCDVDFQTIAGQTYWILMDERAKTSDNEAGQFGLRLETGTLEGGKKLSAASEALYCTGPKAKMWGDPHFVTFDGVKYDCQGEGDFVISKSKSSQFEIQGHFAKGAVDSEVTVTKAVSWIGEDDSATIEIRTDKSYDVTDCPFELYVDGVVYEDIEGFTNDKFGMSISNNGNALIFAYHESGTRIEVTKRVSKKNNCVLGIQLCVSDSSSDIVGMLGSPDGVKENDWMTRDGATTLDLPTSKSGKLFSQAYNYCVDNWCVESDDDSLFQDYNSACGKRYTSTSEQVFNALTEEDLVTCHGDEALCMELADGGSDSLDEALETLEEFDDLKNTPSTGDFDDIVIEEESGTDIVFEEESGPVGAFGDPHITLWTGKQYDFHGACDLVLVKNPSFQNGLGLTIHLRTKFSKMWSFIESAVLRIGNDTLELKGSKDEALYWINGEFQGDISQGIAGHHVEFETLSTVSRQLVVNLNGKEKIILKMFRKLVRVDIVFPTKESFGSSEGLMGAYPTGEKLGRDKTVIEDINTFGKEWQVLADEDMLFRAGEGVQAPELCPLPDVTAHTLRSRRLGELSITEEDAKLACARVSPNFFNACVFDVLAINDADAAGSY